MFACGFSMNTRAVQEPCGRAERPLPARPRRRVRALDRRLGAGAVRGGRRAAAPPPVQHAGAGRPGRRGPPLPQDPPLQPRRRGQALRRRHRDGHGRDPGRRRGFRTTLFICYDLRFADLFWDVAEETDLYVVVANWPVARRRHWKTLLAARAIENQAYVVGVNRVGERRRPRLRRRQPDPRPDGRQARHRRRAARPCCSPTSTRPGSSR